MTGLALQPVSLRPVEALNYSCRYKSFQLTGDGEPQLLTYTLSPQPKISSDEPQSLCMVPVFGDRDVGFGV